jgi:hypothetical protein
MKQLRKLPFLMLSFLYLFFLMGCKKDEDSTLKLPSTASMDMDFSFISETKSASENQTQVNHKLAKSTISFWSLIVTAHTAIPLEAFKKAMENTPTYDDYEKIWEWTYITTYGGDSYNTRLTGIVSDDSVQWKMYLSKVGDSDLSNYLWFEGHSQKDHNGGWWMINYPRTENGVILSDQGIYIKWSYTSDLVSSLKYIYVASKKYDDEAAIYIDNPYKGSIIEYGRKIDTFDSYYSIYSVKETKKYDILWNKDTYNGQMKVDDIVVGCWDTDLADVTCCD